jgi:hypothetical protein
MRPVLREIAKALRGQREWLDELGE